MMPVIDSLPELIDAITRPSALAELAALAVCLGLAWGIVRAASCSVSGVSMGCCSPC